MNAANNLIDQCVSRPRRSHATDAAAAPVSFSETAPPNEANPASAEADLARALSDLLTRYVFLLDSSWHGGWDQSDDTAIRSARAVLTQGGFAAMFPDEIARHLDLALPGGSSAARRAG